MAASFRIRLDIEDHGWASVAVSCGDHSFETDGVSNSTDALGDMIRAAVDLLRGADSCRFSFDGEPVETRWVLDRDAPNEVRLRLLQFPHICRSSAFDPGVERFSAVMAADSFVRAVLREADRIHFELGEADYEKRWGTAFPAKELEILRTARKA
ncbi:hypothetical protein [Brevundimonas poindexterae]|uniref:hypothetical protein n=1 Tax=Brevundimonas poindexterae TaxID=74325 RepID=UPI001CFD16EF|nr:hypothetical protein [Brevundimonas poindexterae]